MSAGETRIQGLDELERRMKAIGQDLEHKIIYKALRAGLAVVKTEAVARVPVDTEALKKSLRVAVNKKALKRGVARVDVVAGNKTAWYAHLVEFGTASYYVGSGRTVGAPYKIKPTSKGKKALLFGGKVRELVVHPGIKPQPFMTPASSELDGRGLQAFVAETKKQLLKYEARN